MIFIEHLPSGEPNPLRLSGLWSHCFSLQLLSLPLLPPPHVPRSRHSELLSISETLTSFTLFTKLSPELYVVPLILSVHSVSSYLAWKTHSPGSLLRFACSLTSPITAVTLYLFCSPTENLNSDKTGSVFILLTVLIPHSRFSIVC